MLLYILAAFASVAPNQGTGQPVGGSCPQVAQNWITPRDGLPDHRIMLAVRLRGDEIIWGGRTVNKRELHTYLVATRAMNPLPTIIFDPSGASDCVAALELRDLIDEAVRCQDGGICGQGAIEDWLRSAGQLTVRQGRY